MERVYGNNGRTTWGVVAKWVIAVALVGIFVISLIGLIHFWPLVAAAAAGASNTGANNAHHSPPLATRQAPAGNRVSAAAAAVTLGPFFEFDELACDVDQCEKLGAIQALSGVMCKTLNADKTACVASTIIANTTGQCITAAIIPPYYMQSCSQTYNFFGNGNGIPRGSLVAGGEFLAISKKAPAGTQFRPDQWAIVGGTLADLFDTAGGMLSFKTAPLEAFYENTFKVFNLN